MSEITASIELYDSDIIAIEKVAMALKDKEGKSLNLEAFRKEIIGRFDEIGLRVNVKTYETNTAAIWFEIEINGRHEAREYDYERQQHEIVNDLLGIEPEKKGKLITGIPNDPKDTHHEGKNTHNH